MQCRPQNSTDRKNYNCIDLAKFICAIMVVMIHIAPFGSPGETIIISHLNYFVQNYLTRVAVPFFFVCSGFFLYKKTSLAAFSTEPTKKYAMRLFKLYVIWTLIYFPLSFKAYLRNEKDILHAVSGYVRSCIFQGSYTQLWYFPAIIFAVLLTSFLLYKKLSPKKITIAALILYLIGLLAQSWFGLIEPLRDAAPQIWSLLKNIQQVIGTTRDGLFDGFIFVGFGMLFAFYDFSISKKKALIAFIISMVLMLFEVYLLEYFDFARAHDMYLFLLPATFFGFSFISQVKLPDHPIYKKLRMLSSLIFYSHLRVSVAVGKLKFTNEPLSKTRLLFIITLITTIVFSLIVIKLSDTSKFKWLKKFYT